MPGYKLKYFPARGRAELSRLIFAAAGQEFEDERIPGENWPEHKPKMPYGQLPVLFTDDMQINQSGAIQRFLARRFGLYGKTDDKAKKDKTEEEKDIVDCDIILDTARDLHENLVKYFFEKDETKKAEVAKDLRETNFPQFFDYFNIRLKKGGYLVGNKLTVADLALFEQTDRVFLLFKDYELKDYPEVKNHYEKIKQEPKIKAYLAKRPETTF